MYRDQRVGVAKMEKRGAADIKGKMLYRRRSKKRRPSQAAETESDTPSFDAQQCKGFCKVGHHCSGWEKPNHPLLNRAPVSFEIRQIILHKICCQKMSSHLTCLLSHENNLFALKQLSV